MLLQPLQSDTPYKITVVAVYDDGDGGQVTGNGKTGIINITVVSMLFLILHSKVQLTLKESVKSVKEKKYIELLSFKLVLQTN